MRFHLIAQFADELVRDHEDEDLRSSDGLTDVWQRTLERSEGTVRALDLDLDLDPVLNP